MFAQEIANSQIMIRLFAISFVDFRDSLLSDWVLSIWEKKNLYEFVNVPLDFQFVNFFSKGILN